MRAKPPPKRHREVLGGGNPVGEPGNVCVQIAVVDVGDHLATDQVGQALEVDQISGGRVDVAADHDLDRIVVAVEVDALSEEAAILIVGPRRVPQLVGGVKRFAPAYTDSGRRCHPASSAESKASPGAAPALHLALMRPRLSGWRSAVVFATYAIGISWICWLPLVAANHRLGFVGPTATPVLLVLGTFGPLLAAVAMVSRTSGHAGLREFLGQALRWRVGIQWYAAALVAPIVIQTTILGVHVLKGGIVPNLFDSSRWLATPATFILVLLIGGPSGEEFGWRGFLLPRVQPILGMLKASVAIGVVSAVWHLPLFLIPITAQSHLPFGLFVVRTIALSIISTWLYNGSRRSLLLVLLFHASLNTWPNSLYVLQAEGVIGPYVSTTIVYTGWAVQLVLMGLLSGRGDRRKRIDAASSVAA